MEHKYTSVENNKKQSSKQLSVCLYVPTAVRLG